MVSISGKCAECKQWVDRLIKSPISGRHLCSQCVNHEIDESLF